MPEHEQCHTPFGEGKSSEVISPAVRRSSEETNKVESARQALLSRLENVAYCHGRLLEAEHEKAQAWDPHERLMRRALS